ncbi:MAG: hypothetical protein ACYTG0_32415 [Planctomycetota bacterium]|jgi:hypothetical protein
MARSRKAGKKTEVRELLDRLAAREQEFLEGEFLAPALRGGTVAVRIGGVVCKIRVEPADFEGWGVFRPASHTQALLVRQASLSERRRYLDLFALVRQIICRRAGNTWYGSTASFGDTRIRFDGLAAVHLAEEVQLFDCVRTRYDGSRFWFDEADERHDPAASAYLRSALDDRTAPEDLHRRGLTAEERAAYELNYWELVQPVEEDEETEQPGRNPPHRRRGRNRQREGKGLETDPAARRLRESLSHAGARLVDYLERADSFRVRFMVGRREYTSSVAKDDLTVHVAGICLSGEDRKFDLASLVGVLRQGEQGGEVYEVGPDGMDEEEYWRVHPPRER